ncbi:hypothetical protein DRP53_10860 [candidate division WOR-3 bacterium]|uniref:Uncharacterized protein n=1 Tax=candidate division WOR-3 bacterium TaxID=2052148 RepID=A0A660SC55_UNCW3|nr:MAG: hypothetical protein DRP53_10860 [candidate division WOR-3 bacterium]
MIVEIFSAIVFILIILVWRDARRFPYYHKKYGSYRPGRIDFRYLCPECYGSECLRELVDPKNRVIGYHCGYCGKYFWDKDQVMRSNAIIREEVKDDFIKFMKLYRKMGEKIQVFIDGWLLIEDGEWLFEHKGGEISFLAPSDRAEYLRFLVPRWSGGIFEVARMVEIPSSPDKLTVYMKTNLWDGE